MVLIGMLLLPAAAGCGGSATSSGTLVVLLSARQPGQATGQISIHSSAGWKTLAQFSGEVPAAPRTVEAAAEDMPAGVYDGLALGAAHLEMRITVTGGRIATALIGVERGAPSTAELYSGQDAVNVGLRELAGRYAQIPHVDLRDQHDQPVDTSSWIGHVAVVGAFTTTSDQQPALMRLYRSVRPSLPARTQLGELTTNPSAETPAVLDGYAARNGVDWPLMTGEPASVGAVLGAMGAALGARPDFVIALTDQHGYVLRRFTAMPDPAQLLDAITHLGSDVSELSGASTEPRFKVAGWSGATIDAATFAGRPLVINFWAAWCAPCRTEMPLLDAAVRTHPGVAFLFVDERDDQSAARHFVGGLGLRSPVAADGDGSAGAAFGVQGLPTTVFIGAGGTIESTWAGQIDSATLDRHLAAIAP